MAAAGLGLIAVQPADASCAGPQLRVQQNGAPIEPRRVGEGLDEQLLYDVTRNQPLQATAFNLTFACNDTYAGTPGCGAPPAKPVKPEPAIQDAKLQLEQNDRRWTLGRLDIGQELSSNLDVRLPAALRPGSALLMITDPVNGDYAELTLVIP